MIVDAKKVQDVVEGRKTAEVKAYRKPDPPAWATVGKVVPVQVVAERPTLVKGYEVMRRRPGQAICHIRILSAKVIDLDDLTDKETKAAGFRSMHAFLDDWGKRHAVPEEGVERVLVVSFERAGREGRDEYLAPSGSGADYTTDPRRGLDTDAPVLRGSDLDDIASAAGRHARDMYAAEQKDRERLDVERRVVEAMRAAELKRVDLKAELEYLRRLRPQQREAKLRVVGVIESRVFRPRNAHKDAA